MKSFVEQLTRAGAPDCFALTSPYPQDRKLEFPTTALRTKVFGGGPGIDGLVVGGVDPLALLAWVLGPEKVLARLNEEIELRCNDPHAITDEDRAKRVSELNAKILEAERQEEAIVCALESDGMTIARRPDADPRAILTLASTLPPPEQI